MSRTAKKRVKKGIIIGIFISLLLSLFLFAVLYRNVIFDVSQSLLGNNTHSVLSSYIEPSELHVIEERLRNVGIEFESVSVGSEAAFVVRLKNGPVILLSDKKDVDWQISSLQSIILRLTIEHKQVSTIDFRYSKPVIYF